MSFPGGSDGKKDPSSILGWENPWRREWTPTPVFKPGECHEQRSLVGYSLWGHKESDMTKQLHTHTHTTPSHPPPIQYNLRRFSTTHLTLLPM